MTEHVIPWGGLELKEGELSVPLPLNQSLHIKQNKNEILITRNDGNETAVNRYITGMDNSLFLEPGLPDLPMTLKPQVNLSILPGKKLDAMVEVPLVIKILTGSSSRKTLLQEFSLDSLSRSFFGNPDNGEISYFLESPLYHCPEDYEHHDSSVYCPLSILNRSVQSLEFERMILRVPYLSLYYGKKHIYGSSVNISFRGADQISQINHNKNAPQCEDSLKLASSPRQAEDNSLLKRSFYFIKTLYTG